MRVDCAMETIPDSTKAQAGPAMTVDRSTRVRMPDGKPVRAVGRVVHLLRLLGVALQDHFGGLHLTGVDPTISR